MNRYAAEYTQLCATPLISIGNSSAVMVQGILRSPIMDATTYNITAITGIQFNDVTPEEKLRENFTTNQVFEEIINR